MIRASELRKASGSVLLGQAVRPQAELSACRRRLAGGAPRRPLRRAARASTRTGTTSSRTPSRTGRAGLLVRRLPPRCRTASRPTSSSTRWRRCRPSRRGIGAALAGGGDRRDRQRRQDDDEGDQPPSSSAGAIASSRTRPTITTRSGCRLTLLKLTPRHERAVLEMGMYAPGEIRLLCELARPRVGVVTNVGPCAPGAPRQHRVDCRGEGGAGRGAARGRLRAS